MKKMVLAMCAQCILLLTAHTQYVQPQIAKGLQSPVEFVGSPAMMQDKISMLEDSVDAAVNDSNEDAELPYGISGLTNDKPSKPVNFERNRGNLPWPVATGTVAIHFGPYAVDGVKGFSDGIYINLAEGDSIKAVADGVISGVFDVDGSNAVIIKHGKYFTTYNNLVGIAVNKGDSVKAGKVLGITPAANTGDSQLLFMVNDEKGTPLDPERWLRRI